MRPVACAVLGAITCAAAVADLRAQNPDQLYFEFQVTKPAQQAPGSRAPRYPVELRAAGVQGRALVQFIVDTLGTPVMSSFKLLLSDHKLFSEAVLSALPDMRFTPAELNGRKVRQLVQQPFVFAIAGREGEMPKAPYPEPSGQSTAPLSIPGISQSLTPAPHAGTVDGWMIGQRVTVDSGSGMPPAVVSTRIYGAIGALRIEINTTRTEAMGPMVLLIDSTANRMSLVMTPQKMVSITRLDDERGFAPRMEPFSSGLKITDLGEGERIVGLSTRHYRVDGMSGVRVSLDDRTCVIQRSTAMEVWTTDDATMAAIQHQLLDAAKRMKGAAAFVQVAEAMKSDLPPGTPLKRVSRTTIIGKDGAPRVVTSTVEVTSHSEGPIGVALFEAPEGYQLFDASAALSGARPDSVRRSLVEKMFARMVDSTSVPAGETRTCTTSSKP